MKKKRIWGELALLTAALIWGTSFVMLKETLDSVPTFWVLALRFTISALLISVFAFKKFKNVDKKCISGSVLLGILLAAAYIMSTYGLAYTTPGKNAFLGATYCVLVPFMIWLFYKRRPSMPNIAGAGLCLVGIALVSLEAGFGNVNIGDILTLLSGIFYALQIIFMEKYNQGNDPICISAIQFITGAVICWMCALAFEPAPKNVPSGAWWTIAYLGIMCTGVCFYLEAIGLHYTPSPVASIIMTSESVFGVLISVIFYNEILSGKTVLGFVLIFIAVLISQYVPKSQRMKELRL